MIENKLRIIYMGTPDFAVPALRALIDSHHEVVAVYTQPPRPKGRGHKLQKSPVHDLADIHDIPVYNPASFKKDKEAARTFISHNADVAIVAAYGLILPQSVLDAPKHGCLNIHGSLLPKWRGAAPIQYSIWKGDSQTGVTIMQMEAGLDTGPMISKQTCEITAQTTSQSLYDDLSDMGAAMLLPVLRTLSEGQDLNPEIQNDNHSTYASMLDKTDGLIDWSMTASEIDQQIRALNPWPGTYTTLGGANFKIKSATVAHDVQVDINEVKTIGRVFSKQGHILCGDRTVLQLTHVQPPNKAAMDFASALNGQYLTVGDTLGQDK